LRKLLVEAAHAAAHTKNTYLSAFYQRIKARQGAKQAAIALGHTLLVICYHVLARQVCYEELGGNYLDEHDRQATEKRLVRRLEKLGYRVELQPATQVAWVPAVTLFFREEGLQADLTREANFWSVGMRQFWARAETRRRRCFAGWEHTGYAAPVWMYLLLSL
jgi:hypothetical protein